MRIRDSAAFVTGANRGLDLAFAQELLAAGARAAFWDYLTEPFVFARPDVQAKEMGPWQENGEIWRRFPPPSIANHNPDQVFYYDDKFMQRRMDYAPDVTGNPRIAHYTHDPKTFDGFVFPTRRLVHLRDENSIANQKFAAITVQVSSVDFVRG
jgi:hypothetical protein